MKLSPWFFSPRNVIYGVGVEVGGASGGPRDRGAPRGRGRAAHAHGQGVGPLSLILLPIFFYIFQKLSPWICRTFRELLFLHKNKTMAVLLKTASVQVSSIQIIQVRVQNKGKSFWKSRYDGDVSVIGVVHDLNTLCGEYRA